MATNTILKNYPFGDGVAVAASTTTTKPDSPSFIDMTGAKSIWLTGSYTGDSTSVYFVVYGYADSDDNADPLITLELDSDNKHGKTQVPVDIPLGRVAVINNDSVNTVTLAKAILLFNR